jgi:F0F1-type ATP synthase assembly protein I
MIPDFTSIMLVAFLVGIVASGVTNIVKKPVEKAWCRDKKPLWWEIGVRALPVVIGTLLGWPFFDAPWGLVVGGAAGVLSAVLYQRAKKFITSMKSMGKE